MINYKKIRSTFFLLFISASLFSQNIYTFAGNGYWGHTGDGGPATLAQIGDAKGICADNAGNVYFVDGLYVVRKVNSAGIISKIAGTGNGPPGYFGDGGPATSAQFNYPEGIAVDASGNVYIADGNNQRIRKINPSGIITTIAGTGTGGFIGNGGPAVSAQITHPEGIAIDASGNIYFTESLTHMVRKISSSGILTTIAGTGTGGFSGDGGPATLADLDAPHGIDVDAAGNIYFTDHYRIRKINTSGIISTIAGNGTLGYTGDGGPATAAPINAYHLAVDNSGNVYFTTGPQVRMVNNTSGIITTVAGSTVSGYSGDGGPASSALVWGTYGITFDANNNYYIGQSGSTSKEAIRVVCQSACVAGVSENGKSTTTIKLFPNPAKDILKLEQNNAELKNTKIEITNCLGQIVLALPFSDAIDVSSLSPGYYNVRLESQNSIYYSKFVKE